MISITENQQRIIDLVTEVLTSKELVVPSFTPDTVLEQVGLESLDWAQVVIRMEELTGKDPFASGNEYQIKTLSDFAILYD